MKLVAVTSCPTGIAHTYMAAEALQIAAKEMGHEIKVETQGSVGAENVITEKDLREAGAVILAVDTNVDKDRFQGMPMVEASVKDAIKDAKGLITKALEAKPAAADVREYQASGAEKKKTGVYKHLMTGVSFMIPFVVAGGLLIAFSFAFGIHAADEEGTLAWALMQIGGSAFGLMVPILAGYIAYSIADRPGLLVGLVGGFLATSGATFMDPAAAETVPSGFLGGLLAGFAGGYLMLAIEKMCDKMPKALEGIKPVLIYPLLGLGGILVVMCAVNPFMGMINSGMSDGLNAIASNPAMMVPLCALLAGMMSIDMGGPFNKAAYAFATLNLANADDQAYIIMAAVMIGGMVPPIAIALSNTFFKNRWTNEERKNAPVNYVMGLSFITEGAIPYAAGHPLQVIPSCIVGSAVAGALSALFGCKLMAPHGGIFVFATMQGTWYFYLLALAIGAVVGMFMLALLKKPLNREIKKVK